MPHQNIPANPPIKFIAVVCAGYTEEESFITFLDSIQSDSTITYLVLLATLPDPLPACSIRIVPGTLGHILQPGEVVLIPRDSHLCVKSASLAPSKHSISCSELLESVAATMPDSCAAILLAENNLDYVSGARTIRDAGGCVIIDQTKTGQHAASTELLASVVDASLQLNEIPKHLEAFAKAHGLLSSISLPFVAEPTQESARKLFTLVKNKTGLDLLAYKTESITRRIIRRISICGIESLAEYLKYIENNPSELNQLSADMLISVTKFFRDSDVFKRLSETVLPGIIKEAKSHPIRVWIPACATGEEAYTLSILFEEEFLKSGLPQNNLKFFATDLNNTSLSFASRGLYPRSSVAGIPAHLLEKYFLPIGKSYQVVKSIREQIIFAKHNILKDPPFTRLDLVSCRNLLIYLNPAAQTRLLSSIHYALRPGGVLVIGQSESTGELNSEFGTIDPKTHIFFKKQNSSTFLPETFEFDRLQPISPIHQQVMPPQQREISHAPLLETFTNRILSHMGRTCFVLNEQREILFSFGDPGKYTSIMEGRVSIRLPDLLPKELAIPLTTAIARVQKGTPISFGPIALEHKRSQKSVSLMVETLRIIKDDQDYILVFIEEEAEPAPITTTAFDLHQSMRRIRELEEELEFSRLRLKTTFEKLEASQEELQASNEELQASNEELQSTNEELESVNEELQTVNGECHGKIQELTKISEELDSFISSTDIATIFLDADLCIRRFTPTAARITELLPLDLGRPISLFSNQMLAEATSAAKAILGGEPKFEKSLPLEDGSFLIMRATPLNRKNGSPIGATVSFIPLSHPV